MKIQIASPHLEPDEKLEKLVHIKFAHLAKKYHLIDSCDMVLKKDPDSIGKHFFIEAKVAFRKTRLFASVHAESFEGAIDRLIKNLEHQLRRIKEEKEEIW